MKLEFSRQIFGKNTQMSNFMKIRPAGAELFHADGRTDMTKLIAAFRNFANVSKNRRVLRNVGTIYQTTRQHIGEKDIQG